MCACLYARAYVNIISGLLDSYGTAHFTFAIPILRCFVFCFFFFLFVFVVVVVVVVVVVFYYYYFILYKLNHTMRLLLKKKINK